MYIYTRPCKRFECSGADIASLALKQSDFALVGLVKCETVGTSMRVPSSVTIYGVDMDGLLMPRGGHKDNMTNDVARDGLFAQDASSLPGFSGSLAYGDIEGGNVKVVGMHLCGSVLRSGRNCAMSAPCMTSSAAAASTLMRRSPWPCSVSGAMVVPRCSRTMTTTSL